MTEIAEQVRGLSPADLALLRAALVTPTCWDPRVREGALRVVERLGGQLVLAVEK